MPDLATNAIIGVETYQLFADIDPSDEKQNIEELNQFINQASALMERYANRKFISQAITELFDGDGTSQHRTKNGRITTLTSLSYWDGSAFVAIATPNYDFTFEQDSGMIYFRDGNAFLKGTTKNNWQAVYTCGWTLDTIPDDLRECCCEIVKWLFMARKKQGVSSETMGDKTISYGKKSKIPDQAMDIIKMYKRYSYA